MSGVQLTFKRVANERRERERLFFIESEKCLEHKKLQIIVSGTGLVGGNYRQRRDIVTL